MEPGTRTADRFAISRVREGYDGRSFLNAVVHDLRVLKIRSNEKKFYKCGNPDIREKEIGIPDPDNIW